MSSIYYGCAAVPDVLRPALPLDAYLLSCWGLCFVIIPSAICWYLCVFGLYDTFIIDEIDLGDQWIKPFNLESPHSTFPTRFVDGG